MRATGAPERSGAMGSPRATTFGARGRGPRIKKEGCMSPALMSLALVALVSLAILILFSRYNSLVRSQKRVQEAWSGVEVQLRRRASLVPNLVETVRGYADHERDVFEQVARARGALQQAGGAGQTGAASTM